MAIVNDRIPTQPNRKKITNESTGTVEYATVEYADNPTVVGTPINKALFDQVQFFATETENYDFLTKIQNFYPTTWGGKPGMVACDDEGKNIVGIKDKVYYSLDSGQTWNESTDPNAPSNANAITYGNGVFVAVYDDDIYVSQDNGSTWTINNFSHRSSVFWDVVYGGGKFVAVSENTCYVAVSDDGGSTWSERSLSSGSDNYRHILYGNNKFVIYESDRTRYSEDGLSWTTVSNGSLSFDYKKTGAFNNGIFVIVSNNNVYTSQDGITFSLSTTITLPSHNETLPYYTTVGIVFAYNGDFYITVVGYENDFRYTALVGYFKSSTGTAWEYTALAPQIYSLTSVDSAGDFLICNISGYYSVSSGWASISTPQGFVSFVPQKINKFKTQTNENEIVPTSNINSDVGMGIAPNKELQLFFDFRPNFVLLRNKTQGGFAFLSSTTSNMSYYKYNSSGNLVYTKTAKGSNKQSYCVIWAENSLFVPNTSLFNSGDTYEYFAIGG